jgi:cobalt/nickel transport system permease protein
MRLKIATSSRNAAPPSEAPRGLARLSAVWTAPFPQYAPEFVRRPALGYMLSAMFGSGIIILVILVTGNLATHSRKGGAAETDVP